jgi:hypothetical protein
MTNPYSGPQIDFSPLLAIGENIAGGLSKRWQRQATNEALKSGDYNEAFMNLLKAGDVESARALATYSLAQSEQDATNAYRRESLKPDAQRQYDWLYGGGGGPGVSAPGSAPGASPTPASSAQPSGVPSPQEFASSLKPDARAKARQTAMGKNDAFQEVKAANGRKVAEGVQYLRSLAKGYDATSLENAIGPLQGGDPGNILTRGATAIPRLGGEIANWFEGGKTSPTEVRSQIKASALALSAAVKPLIRAPGEGIWTDRDQQLLDTIVGDLAEARDVGELNRRIDGVAQRLNANFGLDIPVEGASEVPVRRVPTVEVSPPTNPNELPVYGSPQEAGVTGVGEGVYPEAGPRPSQNDMQQLKAHANNPQFRAEFEAIYGPGSVDRWLGQGQWRPR